MSIFFFVFSLSLSLTNCSKSMQKSDDSWHFFTTKNSIFVGDIYNAWCTNSSELWSQLSVLDQVVMQTNGIQKHHTANKAKQFFVWLKNRDFVNKARKVCQFIFMLMLNTIFMLPFKIDIQCKIVEILCRYQALFYSVDGFVAPCLIV